MGGGGFGYLALGSLALIIGGLLFIGFRYPGGGAEVLGWNPGKRAELDAQNEIDDLAEMIEAQNERRRRRGQPERTLEEVELEVAGRQRDLLRRASMVAPAPAPPTRPASEPPMSDPPASAPPAIVASTGPTGRSPAGELSPLGETRAQVQEDLDSLLELHNARRARRGQPPHDLAQLREELGVG